MEVRAFEPGDFLAIDLQPAQACLSFGGQTIENAKGLHTSQEAYTVTVNGEIMACIGLIEFWENRRMAWAYLSAHAGPHMVALTWKIRRWLRYHGEGRIEAYIDPTFAPSETWAKLLGFKREGRMKSWVAGRDYEMYARVGI